LARISDPASAAAALRAAQPNLEADMQELVQDLPAKPSKTQIESIEWEIAQRAMRQGMDVSDPARDAKRIKASPLFRDEGDKQESNWLGQAFDRLRNMF